MMLPTHIVLGLALIIPIMHIFPHEFTVILMIGVIIGSIIPDLDMIIGKHRKTLHFPVYSWVFIFSSGLIAVIQPSILTITIFGVLFGVGQHSTSDLIGGGLEAEPWKQTSNKAVYSHHHKSWWQPKYYITYDGSYDDLGLFFITSILIYSIYSIHTYYTELIIILSVISVGYTISRKQLPQLRNYLEEQYPFLRPILKLF